MRTEPTRELLIACALEKESSALRQRLKLDCEFLVTGLGAARTRDALENHFRLHVPSLFVFTGNAGQLDPNLTVGQVIVPEKWCKEDGSCFSVDAGILSAFRDAGDTRIFGRGLTVSSPVVRAKARRALYHKFKARVCDMESAIALEVAREYSVPCLAPKIISDTADSGLSSFWTNFNQNMDILAQHIEDLISCALHPA